MKNLLCLAVILALPVALAAKAQDAPKSPPAKASTTKATFLITGLHCPPCTSTVESSLKKAKGIQSVKVDWQTKKAQVQFDESTLSAQKIAQLIAGTPHMMGGNLHYAGWLALRVDGVKDEATAKTAKEALAKVAGVSKVAAYPAQHSVAVEFSGKESVTTERLIEALDGAGLKARNY